MNSIGAGPRGVRSGGEVLDLRGLKCPLPALFARRALGRAPPGHVLAVLADDPMAPVDLPYMCHQEGYEVLATVELDSATRFELRKPENRK